ncbi:gliding motility lipoprotein GldD [Microbacter margulisiae]|uniref:Gliding motility-associated lipoprotein GldD n=1 Tax=Microbacter margulisiae TaxID=1350067 RepID=A0A7W5DPW9_9PORP|nr:gliding motility lipoprotein GldD [Microbacter margulisiae]MBB3186899.1 gliding motility-associated lipoprotein GldD [Microbacter margulisiae]
MKKLFGIFLLLIFTVTGCHNYTPRPYGYFRIDLPNHAYRQFDNAYPYSFDMSAYAADSVVHAKGEEYWINIYYPKLNGCIYISYKPVHNNLQAISEDCRRFVYKHVIKAEAITERRFVNPQAKVYGILYDLRGDVASPLQFMLTDSVHHVVRGALYFNDVPNQDSIAPVLAYVRKDVLKMIETFHWNKP